MKGYTWLREEAERRVAWGLAVTGGLGILGAPETLGVLGAPGVPRRFLGVPETLRSWDPGVLGLFGTPRARRPGFCTWGGLHENRCERVSFG